MDNTEVPIGKLAETFNNYFLNITNNLQIHTGYDTSPISLLKNAYQNDFSQMKTIPVTEGEILSIINSMTTKNSSGYDGISTKILKICSLIISKPLCHICNTSIQSGVFPDHLKYAVVKPLFKNGSRSNMSNYRPISLLPAFSKIVERVMYSRLNQHLIVNNILAEEQYGFRKGRLTDHDAHTLVTGIFQAWNSKLQVSGIFCDLAKAFNCVSPGGKAEILWGQ